MLFVEHHNATSYLNLAFRVLSREVSALCAEYDRISNRPVRPMYMAGSSLQHASWLYDALWQDDVVSAKRLFEDFFHSLSCTGQGIESVHPEMARSVLSDIGREGMLFAEEQLNAAMISYTPIARAKKSLIERGIMEYIEEKDYVR